jgi:hypothetical protein
MFRRFSSVPKESPESIMSEPEESDEEVFSSTGGHKLRIPDLLRESEPAADPGAALSDNPFAFRPTPSATPPVPAKSTPEPAGEIVAEVVAEPPSMAPVGSEPTNPFAALDTTPAAPKPATVPPPAATPVVVPAPPAEEWGGFGDLGASAESPVAEAVSEQVEPAAPRRGRATEAAADDPTRPWRLAVYILAPYALLMTILAIAGFSGGSSKPEGTPKKKAERNAAIVTDRVS